MAPVEFEDYSIKIKDAMDEACLRFLEEAAVLIQKSAEGETKMGPDDGHDVKGSWDYRVDEGAKTAQVGNKLEASYWEEYGTGEHALHGDGRKGWWVYVEGESRTPTNQPIRTQQEAEEIAESMRAAGLPAHATNGREANRPLHKSFVKNKAKIIRRAEQIIKGGME